MPALGAHRHSGTRLKRNVVALLGRQREILKMGLAVVARIYLYDNALTPSHREIIVHSAFAWRPGPAHTDYVRWPSKA